MSGHTPGPWVASGNGVHCGTMCVATTHMPGMLKSGAQRHIDARLIAAAPDLLEHTRMLAKSLAHQIGIDRKKGDDEGARLKTMTLYLVNETIAKATGAKS